jgi:hypothetical protein
MISHSQNEIKAKPAILGEHLPPTQKGQYSQLYAEKRT